MFKPQVVFIIGDAQHNEAIESVQKQTAHDVTANNGGKAHLDSLRSSREVVEQDQCKRISPYPIA